MADDIEIYTRALKREKAARKQAEKILEEKSRELFFLTQELKIANEKLENLVDVKKSELQGVFDNLVDAYILMDLAGNVISMNTSAIQLFGYNIANEKLNVVKLIYKEDYQYAMNSYYKLIKNGSFTDYQARVYTKYNGIRTVHINASIIKSKNNNSIGAQGIVRDITDQIAYQKQRELLVKNLEKSNKELNDYAHIVSHDLKSPLRSMNTIITWLKEDYQNVLDNNAIQSFEMLLKKVDKMDHLINGILKYSSIDKVDHKKKSIDIHKIVNDIIDVIHIPNHIEVKIRTSLPTIKGDKFRLQQLFQNLISNAIKYNDKEKGKVYIDCQEQKMHWLFSIQDNGKGISNKYHDKVFQIFQTLEKSSNATGIGLSIVKKIIDHYDGTIWIDSVEEKGTTFFFTLKK